MPNRRLNPFFILLSLHAFRVVDQNAEIGLKSPSALSPGGFDAHLQHQENQ